MNMGSAPHAFLARTPLARVAPLVLSAALALHQDQQRAHYALRAHTAVVVVPRRMQHATFALRAHSTINPVNLVVAAYYALWELPPRHLVPTAATRALLVALAAMPPAREVQPAHSAPLALTATLQLPSVLPHAFPAH
jgi:hypothetical protein